MHNSARSHPHLILYFISHISSEWMLRDNFYNKSGTFRTPWGCVFFFVNLQFFDHFYWTTVYLVICNRILNFAAAEKLQEHDHQIPETLQGQPYSYPAVTAVQLSQLPSCHSCHVTADFRVLCMYSQDKNIFAHKRHLIFLKLEV